MIPKKIHILTRDIEILDAETQLTRAWVSINPNEKRTEYTDLSQVWHDASEEPEYSRYILAQRRTFIGELRYYLVKNNSTYPWELNVKDLRITKWCYIDDILPKGGDK